MMKIKVCGITRLEDAIRAADLGASAIGFVFWPKSRRYVEPVLAAKIARRLPADVAPVGVFVNANVEEIGRIASAVGLSAIQLHGDELPTVCDELSYRIIKAIGVDRMSIKAQVNRVPLDTTVLLDAHDPVRRGGTGRSIDWDIAASVAATRRVFLAGGLGPDNVAEAIRVVRPYGVDVSSGVEASPGKKDVSKLREFFDEVQQV